MSNAKQNDSIAMVVLLAGDCRTFGCEGPGSREVWSWEKPIFRCCSVVWVRCFSGGKLDDIAVVVSIVRTYEIYVIV
jgi:hypothetical protein